MIHLLITNQDPLEKLNSLELLSTLDVKKRHKNHIEVNLGHATLMIVKPHDQEDLIQLTMGMPCVTIMSDVPLKPEIYNYLITRVRRSL